MNQTKTFTITFLVCDNKIVQRTVRAEAEYYVRLLMQLQYGNEIKRVLSVQEVQQ